MYFCVCCPLHHAVIYGNCIICSVPHEKNWLFFCSLNWNNSKRLRDNSKNDLLIFPRFFSLPVNTQHISPSYQLLLSVHSQGLVYVKHNEWKGMMNENGTVQRARLPCSAKAVDVNTKEMHVCEHSSDVNI